MRVLGPTYRVSFGFAEGLAEVRIAGRHFRLDQHCLGDFFMTTPSALLDDLLRIAASAYVIDRLVKRRRQGKDRSWPRCLRASVEVLEPDFWSSGPAHALL